MRRESPRLRGRLRARENCPLWSEWPARQQPPWLLEKLPAGQELAPAPSVHRRHIMPGQSENECSSVILNTRLPRLFRWLCANAYWATSGADVFMLQLESRSLLAAGA